MPSVFTGQILINLRCWFNVQDYGKRKILFLTLSTDEALRVGNPNNHGISVHEKERISSSRLIPSDHLYHTSFDLVEWIGIFMDQPFRCCHFQTIVLPRIRCCQCHRKNSHQIDLKNELWLWLTKYTPNKISKVANT